METVKAVNIFRNRKKIIALVLAVVVLFTIAGFFIIPPVLRYILIKKLSENLHRKVSIEKIQLNPYALSLRIKGFKILERGSTDTFVSFDELYVNIQSVSIVRRGLVIKEAGLKAPYVNVIFNEDRSYNFSDLLAEDPKAPAAGKEPFRFSLNNISISNGSIDFSDNTKKKRHTVRDIRADIPFISNLPYYVETFIQPVFEAKFNDTPVSLRGRSKPFADSLQTTLDVRLKDLDIPYYLTYLPMDLKFSLSSAKMDAALEISFVQDKNMRQSIGINGPLTFREIRTKGKNGDPLITLPLTEIFIATPDVMTYKLRIAKVLLESPEVNAVRFKGGKLNLQSFMPEAKSVSSGKKAASPENPVQIIIDEIEVKEGKLLFRDHTTSQPVSLAASGIRLNAGNISTIRDAKGKLSLALNFPKKGSVSAEGGVGISPLTARLKIKVRDFAINPLQDYFTDSIRILVANGAILADGDLLLSESKEQNVVVEYKGSASLVRFASVDQENAEDFLKWDSLYFGGMDIVSNPLSVKINEIALTDFYSRLIVFPDGTLNVQNIFAAKEESDRPLVEPQPSGKGVAVQEDKSARNVKIGKITLQGGTVNFTDKHIEPSYSANLLEVGGRVSGLSSEEDKFADVNLQGTLNNYAPLEISGKINPLMKDLYVDLKIDFRNIDLSPVTPYSGRYVGYTIEKGKLTLNMKYLIADKKIDAGNRLLLDQFTFGETVDSPDATKLPVKFAVALLKDRNGMIDLDLPVTGKLDDPDFHIGRVIIRLLMNLLVKAATSPFTLLGSLFGGGEELSYMEFDYGLSAIKEDGIKKLDTLINALYERPLLKLEITGLAGAEKDRDGLRQHLFERKIKARKLKELIRKGEQAATVDNVRIEDAEYEKYLTMAYKNEKFPKPRNIIGMLKDLPPAEMEKLMLTHLEVKDDDLRALASQRAAQVKDYILKSGKVEPERIFLIDPKTVQQEEKEGKKASRVEFTIR